MGVAAERLGRGFQFARRASHAIWSGEIDNWHEGDHLARAVSEADLNPEEIDVMLRREDDDLAAEIERNEADQRKAGHWGVPLFVFEHEPFFGQDRLDHLIWRMKQAGLEER
jgi:2-hydroxychromene-2-carboxylate isomerase